MTDLGGKRTLMLACEIVGDGCDNCRCSVLGWADSRDHLRDAFSVTSEPALVPSNGPLRRLDKPAFRVPSQQGSGLRGDDLIGPVSGRDGLVLWPTGMDAE